jgi:hypothetical protein
MKERDIQPELLDHLPQGDPRAVRAREEMYIVNAAMGNHRWIQRMIGRHGLRGWKITELGAGDGALSLRLLDAGLCQEEEIQAVDLAARPSHWPTASGWFSGDVFAHGLPESEILLANLFLHHFTDEELCRLGAIVSPKTRLIVAAEPARLWIHRLMGRILCEVAELNDVQHHDMQLSIRAGFRRDELRVALGLGEEWQVQTQMHPLGGYRFLAVRGEQS